MLVEDWTAAEGRRFPAGRRTRNIAGGAAAIQARNFCMGMVTLDRKRGQVPWHNHPQEEIYLILEGVGEMCVGDERRDVKSGQAVYVPSGVFHQLTNIGDEPLRMIYCYGPAGDVDHWKQELEGTLPKAGIDAPPLPAGARTQRS